MVVHRFSNDGNRGHETERASKILENEFPEKLTVCHRPSSKRGQLALQVCD
jgi:hypothetical protein